MSDLAKNKQSEVEQNFNRAILVWLSGVACIGAQSLKKILQRTEKLEIGLNEIVEHSFNAGWLAKFGLTENQVVKLGEFTHQFSVSDYAELLESKNIHTVCWNEAHYPDLLREISNYPMVLYHRGPTDFWRNLPIAVVGTRHLTAYGEQAARAVTRELVDVGATIVSGFMYGADMTAHRAAMLQHGKSVAVLGYGFDYLPPESEEYPSELFLETGNTFVTEYAPFVAANKGTFPTRNRIVAGMSHATVVVEAAQESGSLITAELAAEFGRAVCAIPGPFNSVYSEGTKNLINQGAKLITSGYEVVAEVQPSLSEEMETLAASQKKLHKKKRPNSNRDEIDRAILEFLQLQGADAEVVAEKLHLPLADVLSRLTIMEVQGLIRRLGNKWWHISN